MALRERCAPFVHQGVHSLLLAEEALQSSALACKMQPDPSSKLEFVRPAGLLKAASLSCLHTLLDTPALLFDVISFLKNLQRLDQQPSQNVPSAILSQVSASWSI